MPKDLFGKLVLYDFENDPLDQQFKDSLKDFSEEFEVVEAKGDYEGQLTKDKLDSAEALVTRIFDYYSWEIFQKSDIEYIGMMATDISDFEGIFQDQNVEIRPAKTYARESVAELADLDNVLLTSHSGCATFEARKRLKEETLENLKDYLSTR